MPNYSTPKKQNKRQRLLRERFGKNYRKDFYGDIKGYRKGTVKTLARTQKALASSETPASRRSYLEGQAAKLSPVAEQIKARRARFDKKQGGKQQASHSGIGSDKATVSLGTPAAFTSHAQGSQTVRTKPRRKVRSGR